VPISIPESLVVALPPILSPSSRTFAELTLRQLAPTVGIAATGFCYPGGILQLFHRQDQQILRLPDNSSQIVSTDRISSDHLHWHQLSSTSSRSFKASLSRITKFVQIDESQDKSKNQSTDKQFQTDPED
jgi:hypothetical protein